MQENSKVTIIAPDVVMPIKDLDHPCPCQNVPVKLQNKKGKILVWLKDIGERVEQGEVICEGEVRLKAVELTAPCKGTLIEQCVDMDDDFTAGTILGYIEKLP